MQHPFVNGDLSVPLNPINKDTFAQDMSSMGLTQSFDAFPQDEKHCHDKLALDMTLSIRDKINLKALQKSMALIQEARAASLVSK